MFSQVWLMCHINVWIVRLNASPLLFLWLQMLIFHSLFLAFLSSIDCHWDVIIIELIELLIFRIHLTCIRYVKAIFTVNKTVDSWNRIQKYPETVMQSRLVKPHEYIYARISVMIDLFRTKKWFREKEREKKHTGEINRFIFKMYKIDAIGNCIRTVHACLSIGERSVLLRITRGIFKRKKHLSIIRNKSEWFSRTE